ncbi:glycosyltransferase [Actinopolymorpha pittospori]|uniref:Cellulose synthase/poly-beta-1,6-N-acetylglucosamine synthase-like glycosyltransferase/peptidoglycan/xylan/chitin deacetylase (PgdA/CDA1 family) n=1 Tax=Actinopolymorpha pittospori TaxID=648752 RepID=A0A927R8S2_9ACTN|nr:cellulose synthase/poly-beta-1,6-N-acetylglucosamine synthase-like glycosyltransferase/peptidoglycan/xylan/chitin deacetylase (PgdA/CDA1 family) [Actinopolymorpha pittospori]
MGRHIRRREPRHHWVLVSLLMAALVGVLLIQGYVQRGWGDLNATQPSATGPAGPHLNNARPVVNLSGAQPTGAGMPDHTIALTFEDGPDPRWTPRILDVLRRHHARATFFVQGSKVAQHPQLARRIVAEGHELGSHTYTHVDLAGVPFWQRQLELTLTQKALAGATGLHTRLIRPPYSSLPAEVGASEYAAAQSVGRDGYLVVLTDHDTRDWSGRTPERIVAAATPAGPRGAVVLLHDSGGDRSATVAAVDRLLTRLDGEGYRFTTVSEGLGLTETHTAVTLPERIAGLVLVAGQQTGRGAAVALTFALAIAGVLTVLRLLILSGLARLHARRVRRAQSEPTSGPPYHPPVSVIVPAYNEAAGIAATVRSLVHTSYPGQVEVVVVDDGSDDDTAAIAASLDLPGVTVLRQPNGGKPAALNTGIARARHDILILVDGDTVFQPDTIERLVGPFADPKVGAVSGNTKIGNAGGILGRWQHIEYVIGFNLDRRMFDVLECMPTVPGAIGAFRRQALPRAEGPVSTDTLAEDTDLTMAVCRAGWRVVYEESARAWTEAPTSLRQLWRQRYRWCYGTLQAMWKHRGALVERGPAGRFGRRALPYLVVFQVGLPLLAPAVDIFALYGLFFGQPVRVAAVWAAFVVVQALVGAYALRLDGERLTPLWTLPLQQFVYRQLMYLVVIQSVVTALVGAPLRWHAMRRHGTFAADSGAHPVVRSGR